MHSAFKTCVFAFVAASSLSTLSLEANCPRCQQIEEERSHQVQPTGYYDPSQPNVPVQNKTPVQPNAVPLQNNGSIQKMDNNQPLAWEDDTSSPSSVLQSRPIEGGTTQDEETNPEIRRQNQQKYRNFRNEQR